MGGHNILVLYRPFLQFESFGIEPGNQRTVDGLGKHFQSSKHRHHLLELKHFTS